jgi:predicted N-acetyltransferase YhbS
MPKMKPDPIAEPITVCLATSADISAVTNLINDAFRIVEGFFIDGDRIDEKGVADLLRSGSFLLAQRDGAIVGCVYVELKSTEPLRSYLGLLSVDPSNQQAGLGSMLMEAGEDYCRKLGAQAMDIFVVNLRTDLPSFYRKRGYVETGTSPFPPDVPTKIPCHFIEMSKAL